MSVLHDLRANVAAASAKAAAASPASRPVSDFWLNIGVEIPTVDAEGKPSKMFVSLPVGIALDDMKPQAIKGSNQDWINLAQTKNTLLETLQKYAASMAPGQRDQIPALTVELYRRNDAPASVSTAASNPLVASLMSTLNAKAA